MSMIFQSLAGNLHLHVRTVAAAILFACALTTPAIRAQETAGQNSGFPFNLRALSQVPEVFPAGDELKADGVKSFFYAGPTFKGKPTRIFAYYGVPPTADENPGADSSQVNTEKKYPAIVLIHGGGGTAFDRWVKLWNSRGYAAMDLCGCVPKGSYGKWQRHDQAGPQGWDASFDQIDDPIEDQWTMHAVSAVALAHSLIRSYPEVDAERIGVTGISWGGYLTCIVAGVDQRFQFAAPVYGCGFLGENSAWLPRFATLGPEKAQRWLELWDPSQYLPKARMPMLWVNGTNDFAYPMDSWQRSYRLLPVETPRTLCLRIRMPHGHGPAGENPKEIQVFADSCVNGGRPLVKITAQGFDDGQTWAQFRAEDKLVKAELCFTRDSGKWQERQWLTAPAEVDADSHRVSAQVPEDATVFYLNLFDDRDCVVSTEHVERR